MVKYYINVAISKFKQPFCLQVFAIEFGNFAIKFVPFAIELVPFAIEFVNFATESVLFAIVAFAIEFVVLQLNSSVTRMAAGENTKT